jgi:hypothetical protein
MIANRSNVVLLNATVTQTTGTVGTVSAATVLTVDMMKKLQRQLTTRRGQTRWVIKVDGVEYRHRDSQQCIQMAEERAGTSVLGYLYRFDWDRSHRCLKLTAYRICKKTPKGWRILINSHRWSYGGNAGKTKLVLDQRRRAFARPTIEAALNSYKCRKTMYSQILQHKLDEAKESLAAASLPEAFMSSEAKAKRDLAFLIEGEVMTQPAFANGAHP